MLPFDADTLPYIQEIFIRRTRVQRLIQLNDMHVERFVQQWGALPMTERARQVPRFDIWWSRLDRRNRKFNALLFKSGIPIYGSRERLKP